MSSTSTSSSKSKPAEIKPARHRGHTLVPPIRIGRLIFFLAPALLSNNRRRRRRQGRTRASVQSSCVIVRGRDEKTPEIRSDPPAQRVQTRGASARSPGSPFRLRTRHRCGGWPRACTDGKRFAPDGLVNCQARPAGRPAVAVWRCGRSINFCPFVHTTYGRSPSFP